MGRRIPTVSRNKIGKENRLNISTPKERAEEVYQSLSETLKQEYARGNRNNSVNLDRWAADKCVRSAAELARKATEENNIKVASEYIQQSIVYILAAEIFLEKFK